MIAQGQRKDNPKQPVKALSIGFVMDPMEHIDIQYDSSVSLMMEAEKRGHRIYYFEPRDIYTQNHELLGCARKISIPARKTGFRVLSTERVYLKNLDVLFIRKDPPFDLSYLYLMQILTLIEKDVFVINSAHGIERANEKLYILEFPRWIPPTTVTNDPLRIEEFQKKIKSDIIIKPLDQKGGAGIKLLPFRLSNSRQALNRMTRHGTKWVMVQKFIKASRTKGDKRILLLNGNVLGQFRRIPVRGEFRANLSLGGMEAKATLTNRERKMVRAIRPKLIRDGLYFVGIDIVDGYLIEINVTSPAGLTVLEALDGKRLEPKVIDFAESRVLH